MFIVCNYLDVCRETDVPDGFIVEQCSAYDESLNGLVVICREHRIGNVLDWAKTNMGAKYPMFEKQFSINKTKAMCFIKAKGSIKSFTEELVLSCGGIDEFKKMFLTENTTQPETDEVLELDDVTVSEPIVEPEPVDEPEPVTVVQSATVSENEAKLGPSAEDVADIMKASGVGPTMHVNTTQVLNSFPMDSVRNAAISGSDDFERLDEIKRAGEVNRFEERKCHRDCIYNADGSFKGFTEGDILSLVAKLRDMNNRIALDDLDPDKVLTKSEFAQVATYLDTVSPSIIKAFILHELDNVSTETDRIRMSAVLDKLSTFISTLNKE